MLDPSDKSIYEFENFRLDMAHLMLYRNGAVVSLTPKQVETLVVLVESSGEVVSKNELMTGFWGKRRSRNRIFHKISTFCEKRLERVPMASH